MCRAAPPGYEILQRPLANSSSRRHSEKLPRQIRDTAPSDSERALTWIHRARARDSNHAATTGIWSFLLRGLCYPDERSIRIAIASWALSVSDRSCPSHARCGSWPCKTAFTQPAADLLQQPWANERHRIAATEPNSMPGGHFFPQQSADASGTERGSRRSVSAR